MRPIENTFFFGKPGHTILALKSAAMNPHRLAELILIITMILSPFLAIGGCVAKHMGYGG